MWQHLLDFWFGDIEEDQQWFSKKLEVWFAGGPKMDQALREKFGHLLEEYQRTGLTDWEHCARGSLAKVIVLDQLPRNLYRGQAEAYAFDADARSLADNVMRRGDEKKLHSVEKIFLYLPFEHSEDIQDQKVSVGCFKKLLEHAPAALKNGFQISYDYALKHEEVIRQYGRFPHRNEILGRKSTPGELKYLSDPESGF